MNKRIYVVMGDIGNKIEEHLVKASTASQAIRHVVSNTYDAKVPSQDKLVDLISKGVKIQEAGQDE